MEQLEIMKQWIVQFPGWGDTVLTVDTTDSIPGSCGLFPRGRQPVSCREDVLGNRHPVWKEQFLLRRVAGRGEDAIGWILDFGRWADRAEPPALGEHTRVYGEKGRLAGAGPGDTAIYEVTITVQYEKEN